MVDTKKKKNLTNKVRFNYSYYIIHGIYKTIPAIMQIIIDIVTREVKKWVY